MDVDNVARTLEVAVFDVNRLIAPAHDGFSSAILISVVFSVKMCSRYFAHISKWIQTTLIPIMNCIIT